MNLDELGNVPNDNFLVDERIRLMGEFPLKKIIEAEIKRKWNNADQFEKLLKEAALNRDELRRLTDVAIKYQNKAALEGFAHINRMVVAEALQTDEAVKLLDRRSTNEESNAPEIFFLIRNYLEPKFKKLYRRLARSSILHLSLKIAAKWLKGEIPKKVQYDHGLEFDLEDTLEIFLEKGFKVKVTAQTGGRNLEGKLDEIMKIALNMFLNLEDVSTTEAMPKISGRRMVGILKPSKKAKSQKKKD